MAIRHIKYGGSVCGTQEKNALIKAVNLGIKTGNWQAGEQARLMEQEAAQFLNVKHGILTTSGSCAGLLALEALELPKGSEVIISTVTFPTIFNIILQQGLVPVLVDAKIGTYVFDVNEVEKAITPKTKAIIAIHAVGNPCDMPKLMKIAKKHSIKVIEDGADTWGGSINGKMIGSFGDVSFTSFHAAHIVSMGVGGGIFTNDTDLACRIRQYRDWGRQANTSEPHKVKGLPEDHNPRFVYDKIGYNFQILELQAAMGRVQLKKAKRIKAMRKANFDYLVKHLSKFPLIMPKSVKGSDVCWFALPITVKASGRGNLIKHLEDNGIETRSLFAGDITKHPAYAKSKYRVAKTGLLEANEILKRSFWIGVHPRMTTKDRKYVVQVFAEYYNDTSR